MYCSRPQATAPSWSPPGGPSGTSRTRRGGVGGREEECGGVGGERREGECHKKNRSELGRDRGDLNSEEERSVHHKLHQITSLPS